MTSTLVSTLTVVVLFQSRCCALRAGPTASAGDSAPPAIAACESTLDALHAGHTRVEQPGDGSLAERLHPHRLVDKGDAKRAGDVLRQERGAHTIQGKGV